MTPVLDTHRDLSWKKRLKSAVAGSKTFAGFVALMDRLGDNRPDLLRVLTYHRVARPEERPELDPLLISATPQAFARQMEILATRYRPISLPMLLERLAGGRPLPPRSVLVTFDDAYEDFQTNAWPILQKHGIPATLFVPTAFPDDPQRPFWWDRLHRAIAHTPRRHLLLQAAPRLLQVARVLSLSSAQQRVRAARLLRGRLKLLPHAEAQAALDQICRQLGDVPAPGGVLSWDALRRLAAEGLTLGAHTRTHPLMNRVPPGEARQEAAGSRDDLRREIGTAPPVFAYPAGGCSPEVAAMLKREGFEAAFGTRRGMHDLRTGDRMRICRINVSRRTTPAALHAQLLPWMRYLDGCLP